MRRLIQTCQHPDRVTQLPPSETKPSCLEVLTYPIRKVENYSLTIKSIPSKPFKKISSGDSSNVEVMLFPKKEPTTQLALLPATDSSYSEDTTLQTLDSMMFSSWEQMTLNGNNHLIKNLELSLKIPNPKLVLLNQEPTILPVSTKERYTFLEDMEVLDIKELLLTTYTTSILNPMNGPN